jgi:glutamyl-tRNA synthetase
LPYVAEPGGTAKLSKRKLDRYLKQKDFASLFQLGETIAKKSKVQVTPETFNPVVVDFYRETGFLPGAILNYLLLLGWSLDDSTEDFTLEEAIRQFSLERVNKAPASFDPQKLLAFQTRWMNRLDAKKKIAMVLPYLQRAGWVSDPPPCDIAEFLSRVAAAAGDRLKVAGDILQFEELFVADDQLSIDPDLYQKRIAGEVQALPALEAAKNLIATASDLSHSAMESSFKQLSESMGVKLGLITNALRVALTGKATGLSVFDYIGLLGPSRSLARIDRILAKK